MLTHYREIERFRLNWKLETIRHGLAICWCEYFETELQVEQVQIVERKRYLFSYIHNRIANVNSYMSAKFEF